jgi:hypothetical protein
MGEIGIHFCLILDVRKEMNGRDINLDQAEHALFVGRVSNEGNGVARKVEMDLRGKKVLGTAIGRPLGIPCTKKEEKKIVLFVA